MRPVPPTATSTALGLLGRLAGIGVATLLDVRPHRFEIDLLRAVRAIHAPQPALTLTFPKQEHADRVLLDQQGERFNRADDCQASCPAVFLTNLNVPVENAAFVESVWSDGCDCPNDRKYRT